MNTRCKYECHQLPLDSSAIDDNVVSEAMTANSNIVIDCKREPDLDVDGHRPSTTAVATDLGLSLMSADYQLMANILSEVPNKTSKEFKAMLEKGVHVFTSLSHNHRAIERSSDETRDTFNELKASARQTFRRMHALLEMREKEFIEDIDRCEAERLEEIEGFMKKIERKQAELKGKLLDFDLLIRSECADHLLNDFIDEIDANHLIPPETEHQIVFDNSIESSVKSFGSITIKTATEVNGVEDSVNEPTVDEELNGEHEVEHIEHVMVIDDNDTLSVRSNDQMSQKEVVRESSRTDGSRILGINRRDNKRKKRRNEANSEWKKYRCDWPECVAKFNERNRLKNHILSVHKKERPFKCDICNKSFGYSTHLLRHKKTCH